jgi:hypothetical protein
MRFAGLKNIFNIHLQLQLSLLGWRFHDAIMTVGDEDESRNIFLGQKNKSSYSYYEYGSLVVFIRNHSAEIWGFRNGLKLVIGTKKNVAGTGVFVRVVCALNCATKSDPSQPSMILAHRKIIQSRSPQK